jgi:hypothetical protein
MSYPMPMPMHPICRAVPRNALPVPSLAAATRTKCGDPRLKHMALWTDVDIISFSNVYLISVSLPDIYTDPIGRLRKPPTIH